MSCHPVPLHLGANISRIPSHFHSFVEELSFGLTELCATLLGFFFFFSEFNAFNIFHILVLVTCIMHWILNISAFSPLPYHLSSISPSLPAPYSPPCHNIAQNAHLSKSQLQTTTAILPPYFFQYSNYIISLSFMSSSSNYQHLKFLVFFLLFC